MTIIHISLPHTRPCASVLTQLRKSSVWRLVHFGCRCWYILSPAGICLSWLVMCISTHIFALTINRNFVFIIIVQFMMSSNSRTRFGSQIVLFCLYITQSHYHRCALPQDIFCRECEWEYSNYLSYLIYNIWGCVFSIYSSPLWWLR